jgi:putative ABC transport system permease protein
VKTGISVLGKSEIYFQKNSDDLASGRLLNRLDVKGSIQVAVIGSQLAEDLFVGENPIGKTIKINGNSYTVVGLFKKQSGFSMDSTSDEALIPYTSAMRTLGIRKITSVNVYMKDSNKSDEIIAGIKNVLNEAFNYHDDSYSVFNMQSIISAIGNITSLLSYMLAGIAAISLIVGGIGIMNMMLVSVTERTTEIGLRKALGAEPLRIQLQFLLESIIISLCGGIVGVFFGLLLAIIVCKLTGLTFVFSGSAVALAFGFSALIGIVFGLAPARKASRLNPIDALRHI